MQEVNTGAKIIYCSYSELTEEDKKLVESAKEATSSAYAPYSEFKVGAALLLLNGEVLKGNNQENAAFPSGMCAERVVTFYAKSVYPSTKIKALAVAAYTKGEYTASPVTPCGSCRQAIAEYEKQQGEDIRVIMYGDEGLYIAPSIKSLLPLVFVTL